MIVAADTSGGEDEPLVSRSNTTDPPPAVLIVRLVPG
jgi:hypothetical protein